MQTLQYQARKGNQGQRPERNSLPGVLADKPSLAALRIARRFGLPLPTAVLVTSLAGLNPEVQANG